MVLIPGLLSAERVDALGEELEAAVKDQKHYFRRLHLWRSSQALQRLCLASQLPVVARELMRVERLRLLYDQAFFKEAGSGAPTAWHNDLPYYPVRGEVTTLWIALDDIDEGNGAMEFIAGSHRWDRWFQPFVATPDGGVAHDYGRDPRYEPLPDFDAERQSHRVLTGCMRAGDVIAFHGLTVHGALGNRDRHRRRRGYAIRYVDADAAYVDGPAVNPLLRDTGQVVGEPLAGAGFPLTLT